jgi:hypothetical protein
MVRMTLIVMFALLASAGPPQDVVPLPQAHAHNDYLHDPPLLRALAHGFTSVEADVFLVGDRLCVAHESEQITPDRTLQSLYLDPLRRRVQENGGRVYREGTRFFLLIDLKTAAEPTYRRLHEVLAQYGDVLTTFGPQGRKEGAVLAIISGNRPLELMRSQAVRYGGYDGRLSDLGSGLDADLMPMISDQWPKVTPWKGDGAMPAAGRQRLQDIVRKAHAQGRLVRFWLTPDGPSKQRDAVWRELLAAGVDLINTDDLKGLQEFLLAHGR